MFQFHNLTFGSILLMGYGLFLLLKAQFAKGYRGMTSGKWYPLKPSDRALFRFAGVPLVVLVAFYWAGVNIGRNPGLVAGAILGGGIFALAFWYLEGGAIKRHLNTEGAFRDSSTQANPAQSRVISPSGASEADLGPVEAPDKIKAALKLGDHYFRTRDYDKALAAYLDALREDPSNAELRARINQVKRRQPQ